MLTEFYHHKIKPRLPAYAFNKHYWLFLLWGPVVFALFGSGFNVMSLTLCSTYDIVKCGDGVSYGASVDTQIFFYASLFLYMISNLSDVFTLVFLLAYRTIIASFLYFLCTVVICIYFFFALFGFGVVFDNQDGYIYTYFLNGVMYAFLHFLYKFSGWCFFIKNDNLPVKNKI